MNYFFPSLAAAIIGVAFAIALGSGFSEYNSVNETTAKAGAGLEECPNYNAGRTYGTIWVKSCKEFTQEYVRNFPPKKD